MIKFACMLCGERFSVQDQLAGKRIKCPKCNNPSVVPPESPRIKFNCQNCGQGIRVLQIHAGKEGKCPKCQGPIAVPSLSADLTDGSETVTVVCSLCNETIKVPKGSKERFTECPECGSNVETSLRGEPVESYSSIPPGTDEDQYDDESGLPEEDEGPDRRLIFVIAGAAVIVLVGLIVLVTAILPSGSELGEDGEGLEQRQKVAGSESSYQPIAPDTRPTGTFSLGPPDENVARVEPAGSSPVEEPVALNAGLQLRLKPGQTYKLRIVSEDKISQTVMEQQQDISRTKTTELELEVDRVDPNGVARLKVTYLALKEEGRGAAAQVQYDSTTPDVPTEYPFAPMYSAMIGQSFVAKVRPGGTMIGLDGIDQMYLGMAETIVQGEDEATRKRISERATEGVEERVQSSIERMNEVYGSRQKRIEHVRDLLKKNPMIAEGQINEMVGNLIVAYPGRPVELGDSWRAKKTLFSLGTVGLDCVYTLKEKTPAVMVVNVSAQIDLNDEPVGAGDDILGSTRTTLKGSYEGTLQIDPSSGWMVRKNATMRCSGEVTIPPGEQMPQAMTMPVTMETVITVEPLE